MKTTHNLLAKGTIWTIAQFGFGQALRFVTNVALTRLLAPELFGIITIVNTLKTGVELVSDVGIGQSIIINKNGEHPDFYGTAWTLNIIRGCLLWLIAFAGARVAADFYNTPILTYVIPIASLVLILSGFTSPSQFLVQKRLEIAKLTIFDAIVGLIFAIGQVLLAYFFPSIWALVFGMILGSASSMIGSYFLLSGIEYRFRISKDYARQILHFGKWIFISSIIYFFSMSFDRLYLGGVIPLALLGVYGIARSISDIFTLLAARLCNIMLFPYVASNSTMDRSSLRNHLAALRLKLLLIAATGFSASAASLDLLIQAIFDSRYHAASWMVPILIIGAWVSVLCSLNESILFGIGVPRYSAIGNSLKFVFLVLLLPLAFKYYGAVGSILVIAASDVFRYIPVSYGQIRERISFRRDDLFLTVLMIGLLVFLETVRWLLGFGTSFEAIPFLN
jgi:O-antigen/teichoic acid export membrane protein